MVDNKDLYNKALNLKGLDSQIDITIEEMAELTKELIKFRRAENIDKIMIKDHISEELCDVMIMVEQMIVSFEIEKEFKEYKNKKIERLKERLKLLEGKK